MLTFSSASFKRFSSNSFSVLYTSIFSACLHYASEGHAEVPEIEPKQRSPCRSVQGSARFQSGPEIGISYVFMLAPFSSAALLGTWHHKGMVALFSELEWSELAPVSVL